MTQRSLAALIVINAVLLAALIVATFAPPTHAQLVGGSQYLMISGSVVGRKQQSAIYVVNLSRGEVMPLMFNSANLRLETFPVRNVGDDARKPIQKR